MIRAYLSFRKLRDELLVIHLIFLCVVSANTQPDIQPTTKSKAAGIHPRTGPLFQLVQEVKDDTQKGLNNVTSTLRDRLYRISDRVSDTAEEMEDLKDEVSIVKALIQDKTNELTAEVEESHNGLDSRINSIEQAMREDKRIQLQNNAMLRQLVNLTQNLIANGGVSSSNGNVQPTSQVKPTETPSLTHETGATTKAAFPCEETQKFSQKWILNNLFKFKRYDTRVTVNYDYVATRNNKRDDNQGAPVYSYRFKISKNMNYQYNLTVSFDRLRGPAEIGIAYTRHPQVGKNSLWTGNQADSYVWWTDESATKSAVFKRGYRIEVDQHISAQSNIVISYTPNQYKLAFYKDGREVHSMSDVEIHSCKGFMFTTTLYTKGDAVRVLYRRTAELYY